MSIPSTVDSPETSRTDALEAVKHAAADAAEAAAKAPEVIGKFFSKTVYDSFYSLSYGVVFSALMVAKLIPKNSGLACGMRDGAIAARAAFRGRRNA
jgi:hypothetical protein